MEMTTVDTAQSTKTAGVTAGYHGLVNVNLEVAVLKNRSISVKRKMGFWRRGVDIEPCE